MIGLTAAVAKALNSALKSNYEEGDSRMPDKALIQLWSEFYAQDLLPQTKAMMKSTTPTLDAYGIFLPSRIGTTVSQEYLQKGLKFGLAPVGTETNEAKKDETTGNQDGGEGLEKDGGDGDEDQGGNDVVDEGEDDGEEDDAIRYGDDAASGEEQDEEVSRVKRSRDEAEDDYGDADEYDEYEYDEDEEYYDEEYD